MSHISEGDLHAYLDQQASPDSLTAIEGHLAGCDACRGQLEDTRRVRARAASILSGARPRGQNAPPFDAILARAGQSSRPMRRWVLPRGRVLAWAATITLALGAGWIARGQFSGNRSRAADEAPPALAVAPAAAPVTAAGEGTANRIVGGYTGGAAQGQGAATPAGGKVAEEKEPAKQPMAFAAREQDAQKNENVAATGMSSDSLRERVQRANADIARLRSRVDSLQRADAANSVRGIEAANPPPTPRFRPAEPPRAAAELTGRRVADDERAAGLSPEQALGGRVLVVPGFDVVSQAVVREPEGVMVRTTQLVADETMLELTQRREVPTESRRVRDSTPPVDSLRLARERRVMTDSTMAKASTSNRELLRSWLTGPSQFTVTRNGFVITARAPMPLDSLKALMARLR